MRGCQKQVIYIKNTGSRHFEDAYFVVRDNFSYAEVTAEKMIDEANRIIKENLTFRKRGGFRSAMRYILPFGIGSLITLSLCLLLGVI